MLKDKLLQPRSALDTSKVGVVDDEGSVLDTESTTMVISSPPSSSSSSSSSTSSASVSLSLTPLFHSLISDLASPETGLVDYTTLTPEIVNSRILTRYGADIDSKLTTGYHSAHPSPYANSGFRCHIESLLQLQDLNKLIESGEVLVKQKGQKREKPPAEKKPRQPYVSKKRPALESEGSTGTSQGEPPRVKRKYTKRRPKVSRDRLPADEGEDSDNDTSEEEEEEEGEADESEGEDDNEDEEQELSEVDDEVASTNPKPKPKRKSVVKTKAKNAKQPTKTKSKGTSIEPIDLSQDATEGGGGHVLLSLGVYEPAPVKVASTTQSHKRKTSTNAGAATGVGFTHNLLMINNKRPKSAPSSSLSATSNFDTSHHGRSSSSSVNDSDCVTLDLTKANNRRYIYIDLVSLASIKAQTMSSSDSLATNPSSEIVAWKALGPLHGSLSMPYVKGGVDQLYPRWATMSFRDRPVSLQYTDLTSSSNGVSTEHAFLNQDGQRKTSLVGKDHQATLPELTSPTYDNTATTLVKSAEAATLPLTSAVTDHHRMAGVTLGSIVAARYLTGSEQRHRLKLGVVTELPRTNAVHASEVDDGGEHSSDSISEHDSFYQIYDGNKVSILSIPYNLPTSSH